MKKRMLKHDRMLQKSLVTFCYENMLIVTTYKKFLVLQNNICIVGRCNNGPTGVDSVVYFTDMKVTLTVYIEEMYVYTLKLPSL